MVYLLLQELKVRLKLRTAYWKYSSCSPSWALQVWKAKGLKDRGLGSCRAVFWGGGGAGSLCRWDILSCCGKACSSMCDLGLVCGSALQPALATAGQGWALPQQPCPSPALLCISVYPSPIRGLGFVTATSSKAVNSPSGNTNSVCFKEWNLLPELPSTLFLPPPQSVIGKFKKNKKLMLMS